MNRSYKKLVLVNSGFNKLNRLASVVLEHASAEKALDELLPALQGGGGSDSAQQAAAILKEASSVAVIIPPRLSAKESGQVKMLLPLLKKVTTYPVVRPSNFQEAWRGPAWLRSGEAAESPHASIP